jgi:hypothetical protein
MVDFGIEVAVLVTLDAETFNIQLDLQIMNNSESSEWKPPTPEKALEYFMEMFGREKTYIALDRYPRMEIVNDPTAIGRFYISPEDVENSRAIVRLRPDVRFSSWQQDPMRDMGSVVARYDTIDEMARAGWFLIMTNYNPRYSSSLRDSG